MFFHPLKLGSFTNIHVWGTKPGSVLYGIQTQELEKFSKYLKPLQSTEIQIKAQRARSQAFLCVQVAEDEEPGLCP